MAFKISLLGNQHFMYLDQVVTVDLEEYVNEFVNKNNINWLVSQLPNYSNKMNEIFNYKMKTIGASSHWSSINQPFALSNIFNIQNRTVNITELLDFEKLKSYKTNNIPLPIVNYNNFEWSTVFKNYYSAWKHNLPVMYASCEWKLAKTDFNTRRKTTYNIKGHTNLIMIDIDDYTNNDQVVKSHMLAKGAVTVLPSPGGGYKPIFAIKMIQSRKIREIANNLQLLDKEVKDKDGNVIGTLSKDQQAAELVHKWFYHVVEKIVKESGYATSVDPSCKNQNRSCYVATLKNFTTFYNTNHIEIEFDESDFENFQRVDTVNRLRYESVLASTAPINMSNLEEVSYIQSDVFAQIKEVTEWFEEHNVCCFYDNQISPRVRSFIWSLKKLGFTDDVILELTLPLLLLVKKDKRITSSEYKQRDRQWLKDVISTIDAQLINDSSFKQIYSWKHEIINTIKKTETDLLNQQIIEFVNLKRPSDWPVYQDIKLIRAQAMWLGWIFDVSDIWYTNRLDFLDCMVRARYDLHFNEISLKLLKNKNEEFTTKDENSLLQEFLTIKMKNADDVLIELPFFKGEGLRPNKSRLSDYLNSDKVKSINPIQEKFDEWCKQYPIDIKSSYEDFLKNTADSEILKMQEIWASSCHNPVFAKEAFINWSFGVIENAITEKYFDKILLLSSKGGEGKTYFLTYELLPELQEYISTELNWKSSPDDLIKLSNNIILLDDELKSLTKAHLEEIKSFSSKAFIKVRLPYDRRSGSHVRIASLVAYSNKLDILTTAESDRRFLICELISSENGWHDKNSWIDKMRSINMKKYWAEIIQLFKANHRHQLTDNVIRLNNTEYELNDPLEHNLLSFFEQVTVEDEEVWDNSYYRKGVVDMISDYNFKNSIDKQISCKNSYEAGVISNILLKNGFYRSKQKQKIGNTYVKWFAYRCKKVNITEITFSNSSPILQN